ncbi:3'-5' exonuclease [Gellertiella hungarica]|uniref:3'-5' exoribonuclease Rv2179c-like domain-containing protein n=1 Tax=Gellertiella hungarica TaxID=1572859 RepID=A0A7W6J4T4_9HYPH|nr:3'-5' exonuclease [Gellertiella hungarica]MBB4064067.1 hypothetical protein [Gellertiella hungarica]
MYQLTVGDIHATIHSGRSVATDFMIDIETLGTRAGCAILSIGAVSFDPRAPFSLEHQEMSLETQFFARIDLQTCVDRGLFVDPKTEAWWQQQSDEARAEAFGGKADLRDALTALSSWMSTAAPGDECGTTSARVWSHGMDFDQPILNHAYAACGLQKPWAYNAGRDTRTVLDLGGVQHKGVLHRAVDDCLAQISAVRRAFDNLGLSEMKKVAA